MGIATTRLGTFTLINVKFYINILILASASGYATGDEPGNTAASTKTRLFAIV